MYPLRIYISSTYDDLLNYRIAAARVIEDCGHVAVDSYAASPHPTKEQCLRDIDRCDALVGIVGLRYGWVPADVDPRSVTHREFDYVAGKTRLMFLANDTIADLAADILEFRAQVTRTVLPLSVDSLDGLRFRPSKLFPTRALPELGHPQAVLAAEIFGVSMKPQC
jgi:hypothetical protein